MVKCLVNKNLVKVIVFIGNNYFITIGFYLCLRRRLLSSILARDLKAEPLIYFSDLLWLLNAPFPLSNPMPWQKMSLGKLLPVLSKAGLKVIAARLQQLSRSDAERFYAVHKARPFYKDLVDFMISGPVFVQVLEGENAIQKNRDLMGATDPKKADAGTIRADFADSIDANAVHGSDAARNRNVEIAFFFPESNIHSR